MCVPLPMIHWSAFLGFIPEACVKWMSAQMALVGLDKQLPGWKPPRYWLMRSDI